MELLTPLRLAAALSSLGRAVRWAVLVLLLPGPVLAAEGDSLEYAVKATYLYKFAAYVDWPAKAFSAPDSPLALCIAGDDPFGASLDSAVRDQRIAGRPVLVRRLKSVGRDADCQILFAGGADPQRAQFLAAVRGSAVLTVTDRHESGGSAGIIDFVMRDNRVRFDIDEAAATRSGLGISSKLLKLALNLRPLGQP
ncbi:YfiR family protein [Rhodoferax ferrireducens]|uniref:YfiR family protein n=1 Tax=Rhodoferax ferrireducens TaxID=192843 RepID=UPI000E0D81EF|nr:YfiR family protein [Rhodoferax ferrireducens]